MGDVFISHSARGDAFAMAVLARIEEGLRGRSHTPLVDQSEIDPGDEWRPTIVDWLARCHAAVVLLNDRALGSHWVRREVNILMWRRALGAPLLVVPVLLGDLTTGVVKKAGLEELRPIQFARTARGVDPDAESLAEQVLGRFADLPPAATGSDPMSAWLGRLAEYLSEARNKPGVLAEAARALKVEPEFRAHATDRHGGCAFLAHQFLVAPPERMEQALHVLAPSLQDQTIHRLTRELTATWVDDEAARCALPAPGEPPREMTVLLNARSDGTADQYIRRATCGDVLRFQTKSIGSLPMGEDRVGERTRLWVNAVWREFFEAESEDDWIFPNDLDARTYYLVINEFRPPDAEFAEAVNLLHRDFAWLIVMVATGTAPPEDRVLTAFKNAILLKPLLTAQDERTAKLRSGRLRQLPGQLAGTC
ncbi:toll/interleukin-1 receptor domain-containing protein [Streptomyces sp. SP17KL33]|uniref:toll/interleukin-1 receptor domain-containing protein n=1 Tax=Streptomyces sp. SP17KL33 TaxID=3002534 RepID=UPI002E790ADD|nr:toll/interleukin-1 receptor domain-containing protein [Streptomyces sp. SP17KL33]MEE1832485.1 toll/interleukin-1 receptor domain-containing protein [Streptomyces sp. SP17KL33]